MQQRCVAKLLQPCHKAEHSLHRAWLSTQVEVMPGTQKEPRRIDSFTRQVSRVIKSGRDEVAIRLLPQLGSQDRPVTVCYCNYLFNSCARSRNVTMAKEVYKFMERNGLKMDDVSYGCFLRTLCRSGHLSEALELLEVLARSKGEVKANLVMYNTVLNGCSLAKSKVHADHCLILMKRQGVAKDEMSYVELMKLSGLLKNAPAVMRWWEELTKKGQPSPSSRCTLIVALCRSKALTEALEALNEMSNVLSKEDPFHLLPGKKRRPFKTEKVDELPVLEAAKEDTAPSELCQTSREAIPTDAETGLTHKDQNLLKGFNHWEVRKELQDSFNALINAAAQAGKYKLAESLFSEMRNLGLRLGIYTFNALLRAVVNGRGIEHGLRVVRSMAAVGVRPDCHTLTTLLDGYCRSSQLDKAESLLAQMSDGRRIQRPSIYTYNIFIKACAPLGDPERALRVFARMKKSGVMPDSYTYCALLAACGNVSGGLQGADTWSRKEVARRVVAIEKDMAGSGVQHTHASVSALMNVLGSEGMIDAVLQNLRACEDLEIIDRKRVLDAISYNTAINSCVQAQKFDEAWEIFKEMRSLGVRPDIFTYNILINACSQKKSVSTAFELVESMHHESIPLDLITYNSLIKVTCHSGKLDLGLELLREMKDKNVQPDVATYNTLLASASYHKRKEITEYLVEEMRLANIPPDTHTCSQVVSLYMRCGDLDEASQALKVLSSRMLNNNVAGHVLIDDESFDEASNKDLLEEAVTSTEPQVKAAFTSTIAGIVQGPDDLSQVEESPWAVRLRQQYLSWKSSSRGQSTSKVV